MIKYSSNSEQAEFFYLFVAHTDGVIVLVGDGAKAASPPAATISIIRLSASVFPISAISRIEPTDILLATVCLLSASFGFGTTNWSEVTADGANESKTSNRTGV